MTLVLKKEGNEHKHGLFSGIRSELTHVSNDGLSDLTSVPSVFLYLTVLQQ